MRSISLGELFRKYFELTVWITALLLLALMPPSDTHYSLCPLSATGFRYCPGCGLGHSISWLFHGDIKASFDAHPLGLMAVAVLTYRIVVLYLKSKQ